MSETLSGSGGLQPPESGFQLTGDATVDTVVESLQRLDELPTSEHVAAFEAAHEKLRAALTSAGSDHPSS